MGFFSRKNKGAAKNEPLRSDSGSSFWPSPASTPSPKATSLTAVCDEKEFTTHSSSRPPPKDNRLFRAPQGPVGMGAQRSDRMCPKCDSVCMRSITGWTNRNGNRGRPYLKCTSARCGNFIWDDELGTHEHNPLCGCDRPSRQSISNAKSGRQVYYECATGLCDFWQPHVDEHGVPVSFEGDPGIEFARMRL